MLNILAKWSKMIDESANRIAESSKRLAKSIKRLAGLLYGDMFSLNYMGWKSQHPPPEGAERFDVGKTKTGQSLQKKWDLNKNMEKYKQESSSRV